MNKLYRMAQKGLIYAVEAKTGKACTFFMRVRPDDA